MNFLTVFGIVGTTAVLSAVFIAAIVVLEKFTGPKKHAWGKWQDQGLLSQKRNCTRCGVSQGRWDQPSGECL